MNAGSIVKLNMFHVIAEIFYSILILGYYVFVLQMKKFWDLMYHQKISQIYEERYSFMVDETNEIDYSYKKSIKDIKR